MDNLIPGNTVNLGGTQYVVPPLSFKQLRMLLGKISLISTIGGVPTDEQMDAIIDVVLASLSRNYPDATREQVEDMLDLGNAAPVIQAIMGASGLEQGEAVGSR